MKSGDILSVKNVSCLGCGRSHLAKRFDARCEECRKNKYRAKAERQRVLHPEQCKRAVAEWRLRNQDKVRAHKRKFQENNRAHRTAYENIRRAMKLHRTPKWADLDAISGMYELCSIFRRAGLDLHVDHILPLQGKIVSGLHVADNLQLLHAKENMRKKNRFSEEIPV